MNTKNILKAMAAAMLMPAMMLTTACSSDDDLTNPNPENAIQKGYELPVTVSVTRQGSSDADATGNRASYNETSKKLEFSSGDQLFVKGTHGTAGNFAGTLTWQSDGSFSGTITTQNTYSGTADDLLSSATSIKALLLPASYGTYGFIKISGTGYETVSTIDYSKAFATSKATAVEQFSREESDSYSSGFALTSQNAILNYGITGQTAGVEVTVAFSGGGVTISKTLTTDTSGNATFAIGLLKGTSLGSCTLKENSNDITITNIVVSAGKIYNIVKWNTKDLSTLTGNYQAQNNDMLTGTLSGNYKITIADGATVKLKNVKINENGTWTSGDYAGITCVGDATIILEGTNTVKGFYEDYPGIFAAVGKTLTIKGPGTLNVSSNGIGAAGIGGGEDGACGNIVISGGTITATGGNGGAGIGSGQSFEHNASCGNITISGGTITATGGEGAAGIGSGQGNTTVGVNRPSTCGAITITSGVTKVTATKGSGATNSIGRGNKSNCGTVTIDGTEYWDGSAYKNGGDTYLTTSPLVYPAP